MTAAFARARPEERRDLLAALYGLSPGTIAGLNADDLGWIDRMKVKGAIRAA